MFIFFFETLDCICNTAVQFLTKQRAIESTCNTEKKNQIKHHLTNWWLFIDNCNFQTDYLDLYQTAKLALSTCTFKSITLLLAGFSPSYCFATENQGY